MQRQGDPLRYTDASLLAQELLLKIPDAQVMSDLDHCALWAGSAGGDTTRLCVSGFGWGGRWAWLYAAHRPVRCAIAWYGIIDGEASGFFPNNPKLFPRHPLDVAPSLQAPMLGLYGARDESIPVSSVLTMQEVLAGGGLKAQLSEIFIYDDAGQGFFADYLESYRECQAVDAWERSIAWLIRWML